MAPELLAGAAGGGDGFDPAAAAGVAAHHIGPPVQPLDAQHGNPLMLLLQSLLPWNVVIPQAGAAPGADGDDGFHEGDYEFDDDE